MPGEGQGRVDAVVLAEAKRLSEARVALERRMQTVVRAISDAPDLVVRMLWNPERAVGAPVAPAWYNSTVHAVTINGPFALQGHDPGMVNPLTPAGRKADPIIMGLAVHEAGHVVSTQWGDRAWSVGLSPAVLEATTLLEEARVEKRHLERRPQDRGHLRAASALIDLAHYGSPSADPVMTRWQAGSACLLTVARRDAGVLYPMEVEHVESVLRKTLGEAVYAALEPLWVEAQGLGDGDVDGLLDVATRWVEVLGEMPPGASFALCGGSAASESEFVDDGLASDAGDDASAGTDDGVESGTDAGDDDALGGEDADPSGDGDGLSPLGEALQEMQEEVAESVAAENGLPSSDASTQDSSAETDEDDDAPVMEGHPTPLDLAQYEKARRKAQQLMEGKAVALVQPHTFLLRDPTDEERLMATRIGQVFERTQYRERTRTRVNTQAPPGRLQSREALLYAAQRSLGMQATARPFRTQVSRHVEDPPVRLGIMVDKSRSMSWAASPMSSLAWACSYALTYVHGVSMSVTYGAKVNVITPLGEVPRQVTEFTANDGAERFGAAFELLNGALNLVAGDGAKVLVVVSDGYYSEKETQAAHKAVEAMRRMGGRVVWIAPAAVRGQGVIPPGAMLAPVGDNRDQWGTVVTPAEVIEVFVEALAQALMEQA